MMKNTVIIAEAGVNHNGSLEIAYKLIDAACQAGADAVKFQSFKAEKLVSKNAEKAVYQKKTTEADQSQYDMIKKLELSIEDHNKLISYCKKKKISFLSSPFDTEGVELLDKLGIDTFKIPSGEITNLPYLRKIGKLNKNVIISTGMADLGEIEDALDILIDGGTDIKKITVLHCNTEYPTPYEDVNLKAMNTIQKAFNVKIGYSDHSNGIEVPIAAVSLGAEVIEKHFTLDRNMEGPDHKASLEPSELSSMVSSIRNIEVAMGDGIKKHSNSEKKNIAVARKSLFLNDDQKKGTILTENNISAKRPGDGITPMLIDHFIGKKLKRDLQKDSKLKFEDVE